MFTRPFRELSSVPSSFLGKVRTALSPAPQLSRAFSSSIPVRHVQRSSPWVSRLPQYSQRPRLSPLSTRRAESTSSEAPRPLTDRPDKPESEPAQRDVPAYELTFTCKPCLTRSKHRISKQGYHHGTVLITCPNCKNRHVISDHLKIFNDESMTVENLLQQKGESIRKGVLGANGDIEFWDDGTTSEREGTISGESEKALPGADDKSL